MEWRKLIADLMEPDEVPPPDPDRIMARLFSLLLIVASVLAYFHFTR